VKGFVTKNALAASDLNWTRPFLIIGFQLYY
jgi:hypothetical protein